MNTQQEFRDYLNNRLSKDGLVEVMSNVVEYLTLFFGEFTEEEIKQMCLDKSDKGAKEAGPEVLVNRNKLILEKRSEVIDLINYTVMEDFQKLSIK